MQHYCRFVLAEQKEWQVETVRSSAAEEQHGRQVDTPFEYAERLAELVQRQQAIEDELDLTKNQASAQLEADAPGEPPLAETVAERLNDDYD